MMSNREEILMTGIRASLRRFARVAFGLAILAGAFATPEAANSDSPGAFDERKRDAEIAELRKEPLRPPAPGESLDQVRAIMERSLAGLDSVVCDVEQSKARKEKGRRRYYLGQIEIQRGSGGRVALTRKGNTDEYVANDRVIWSIDHNKKEAQFIPASTPVVGQYVREALKFNIFLALDADTMRLRGSQSVAGEDCWLVEGKSPRNLARTGVPVSKVRVWIAKSDGLPRMVHIPDDKDDLLIILSNIRCNPPINPARFQWSPPRGMKTKNIFGF